MNTISEEQKNQVLRGAKTSSQALNGLYQLIKSQRKAFSLAFIAKSAGIPSTGYISDVFNQKRTLHKKYEEEMASTLGLNEIQTSFLSTLLSLDRVRSEEKKKELMKKLRAQRKALAIQVENQGFSFPDLFTSFQVYSAFSLFDNRPSASQLTRFFAKTISEKQVKKSLKTLQELKMIEKKGPHFQVKADHFVFAGSEKHPDFHINYLEQTLQHALKHLPGHFADAQRALFSSHIISVNEGKFKKQLKAFREKLLEMQSEMDSADANQLVFFNVAVYPMN